VSVAGIVLCAAWWALVKSYRDLNAAKFGVILAMEQTLPARIFGDEWDKLKKARVAPDGRRGPLRAWASQYREFGRVERVVPAIFALIYVAEIIRQAIG
jgi:hypothetical protein